MSDKSKKEETNRLLDLDVREVSVVDRPANQSPFLIVKNADGVLNIKLEETMQGQDKVSDEAVVAILDLVTEEESAAPVAKDAPDLQAVVEKAAESLMQAAALLKDQQGAEPSQEALAGIAEASSALQDALPADQESDESAEASDDPSDESEPVKDEGLQVYIEKDGDEQCVVVKRGAKMKKARLDQFRKAIDVLNGILTELDGSEQKMNKDDAQKVEKTEDLAAEEKVEEQAAPPAEEQPAEQPAEEPADEQEAASEEAPAPEPEEVEKADPAPEPAPEPAPAPDVDVAAKLTEAVEKALSPVVEKINNLTKRVNELENEGTSNGDAEAGELEQTQKSEEKNLWKGLFSGLR